VTFDEEGALKRTGGDRKLLKQLVGLYRADARVSMKKIAEAIRKDDAEALRTSAHALKGSVATIGGIAARSAAAALEDLGKSGKLTAAGTALSTLRAEIAKLDKAFMRARLVARGRRR